MKTRLLFLLSFLTSAVLSAQMPSKNFAVFYDVIPPKNIKIPDSVFK